MNTYFEIERAIKFLIESFDGQETTKPTVLHSIRCGLRLMEAGFSPDLVIAGILHDVVEDTEVTAQKIEDIFGKNVANVVSENTKDPSITDPNERREDLIRRCCNSTDEVLIVKISDVYDNFLYYSNTNDSKGKAYCLELKSYITKYTVDRKLPEFVSDLISKIL